VFAALKNCRSGCQNAQSKTTYLSQLLRFWLTEQLRKFGKNGSDPLRLVARQQLSTAKPSNRFLFEIHVGKSLPRRRPSRQSSYPVPQLTRAVESGAQAWLNHSAASEDKFRDRRSQAPVSPKPDTPAGDNAKPASASIQR